MNSNNTIDDSLILGDAFFNFTCYEPLVISAIAFIFFWIVVYSIVVEDPFSAKHKKDLQWNRIVAPANALLLLIIAAESAFYVSTAFVNASSRSSKPALVSFTACLGIIEVSYVWLSFIRAQDLLQSYSNERVFTFFKGLLYVTPITSSIPVFLTLIRPHVDIRSPEAAFELLLELCVPGVVTLCLDVYFATSFVLSMRHIESEMNQVQQIISPKFKVLAKFGLYSTAGVLGVLITFVASMAAIMWDPDMDGHTLWVYALCWCLRDSCIFFVGAALVLMKVNLRTCELKRTPSRNVVTTAISQCSLNRVQNEKKQIYRGSERAPSQMSV
ncbi:hypothetical protein BC830DRAFT_1175842 [Chytriomyces sp. MP71]|nr:hypothetical protein BC830DRAFT_1175842 [Chytriomyces sp. MP71]